MFLVLNWPNFPAESCGGLHPCGAFLQALEGMLAEYRGVLLVVSHDRAFLEATAERLFVLNGDGLVRLFDGRYSEVLPNTEASKDSMQPLS